MGSDQILDMNVIADTSPVRRWIIGPKDAHRGTLLASRQQDPRNQMALGLMALAEATIGSGAGDIEIT